MSDRDGFERNYTDNCPRSADLIETGRGLGMIGPRSDLFLMAVSGFAMTGSGTSAFSLRSGAP